MSTLDTLEDSAAALPELLAEVRLRDEQLPPKSWLNDGGLLTTGIGLSGGPARIFALRAAEMGLRARFSPLTEVCSTSARYATIALFSQNLSPNAQLALNFKSEHKIAFTGVNANDANNPRSTVLRSFLKPQGHIVPVPSTEKHPHLVRLHSPLTALYRALRWLASYSSHESWVRYIDAVPEATSKAFEYYQHRWRQLEKLHDIAHTPILLVSSGQPAQELHLFAWKWAETLYVGPPLCVDALELAHGPLQAFHAQKRFIITLDLPGHSPIIDRVAAVLDIQRHTLLRLPARLPPPLSIFEHDAAINTLLLALMPHIPASTLRGPPKGIDAPLYNFDQFTTETAE